MKNDIYTDIATRTGGEKSGDSGKSGNAVVPVAIAAAVVVIAGGAGFVVWKKRRL